MSLEIATLGGGCFWCVEAVYNQLIGVESAISGYMGGHVDNPTYEQVCAKTTGHAEVVNVTFRQRHICFEDILNIFFATHDPTTLNRQGNDVGPQYRSGIWYHSQSRSASPKKRSSASKPRGCIATGSSPKSPRPAPSGWPKITTRITSSTIRAPAIAPTSSRQRSPSSASNTSNASSANSRIIATTV